MRLLCDSKIEPQIDWVLSMKVNHVYKEPKLHKYIVNIIKLICTILKQDVHVFVMAVDLLEDYLDLHNDNILLTIVLVVFICSKTVGTQSDVKVNTLIKIYRSMTKKIPNHYNIVAIEKNIFTTLKNVPLKSVVDDLKLLYVTYVEPMNLKRNSLNLCLHILELIYINKLKFFSVLKQCYIDLDILDTFNEIVSSNFYLICGIVLSSFLLTKYENAFNVDSIINDFSVMSEIHKDHYEILCKKIVELIKKRILKTC